MPVKLIFSKVFWPYNRHTVSMWTLHSCNACDPYTAAQLACKWFSSILHDSALAACKWLTNSALSCLAGSNGDTACQWFSQDAMAGSMHTWKTSRQWCWRHTHVTMHFASGAGGTPTSPCISPVVLAARSPCSHVTKLLAIDNDGTPISPILLAAST